MTLTSNTRHNCFSLKYERQLAENAMWANLEKIISQLDEFFFNSLSFVYCLFTEDGSELDSGLSTKNVDYRNC